MQLPFQQRLRPSWGFYVLSALGGCIALLHVLVEADGIGTVLEAFILVGLAGLLAYSGYDVPNQNLSQRGEMRALGLTCVSIGAFGLLAIAIAAIWTIERGIPPDAAFMILFAGGLGGVVGSRSSLYAIQSEEELAKNRDLTKLLKVNERILRHNLRNELAIALGHLENIEAETGSTTETEQIRTHLTNLLDLSHRARKIVSIWETDTRVEFSVRDLLTDRVHQLRDEYPDADVTVTVPEDYDIYGHPALADAVDEALENAVLHTGPDVEIVATCLPSLRDGDVVVEIADTGCGIAPIEHETLFQPAETALEHCQGLGLWLVYWAVVKSGGEVDFRENTPQGTVVELRLQPATGRRAYIGRMASGATS